MSAFIVGVVVGVVGDQTARAIRGALLIRAYAKEHGMTFMECWRWVYATSQKHA